MPLHRGQGAVSIPVVSTFRRAPYPASRRGYQLQHRRASSALVMQAPVSTATLCGSKPASPASVATWASNEARKATQSSPYIFSRVGETDCPYSTTFASPSSDDPSVNWTSYGGVSTAMREIGEQQFAQKDAGRIPTVSPAGRTPRRRSVRVLRGTATAPRPSEPG
jgi:hypothetical protein